jgi:hypothetical protein
MCARPPLRPTYRSYGSFEARAALPEILGRLGDIQVSGEVTWRPNIASRAVTGLRISHE